MAQSLSDRLIDFKWKIGDYLRTGAKVAVECLILYTLFSQNGMLDSNRTKEAGRLHGEATKTVATVEETWKDDVIYSPMLDGYNPKVIREVTFEDGSKTKLEYRTLAWQPFMKLKNGEEFYIKAGKKYEVTSSNMIVREVE